MNKISAVIAVSKGEEYLLNDCIESLSDFANEVIVFSLGSEFITNKNYIKVIKNKPVQYIELLREEMIKSTNGDWIIILDPDERLTSHLKKKLLKIVNESEYDVVNIPRKNIFFGKWISHTNWWPDRQYRFFRRGTIKWPKKIHTYPEISGKAIDLPAKVSVAIEHYGYNNLNQFIERQIRYSKVEAENLKQKGEKFSMLKAFFYPARNFFVRFVYHRGYLNGVYGLMLSFLTSLFIFAAWIQLKYDLDK